MSKKTTTSFMKRFSYIVDKNKVEMKLSVMYASEEVSTLLSDLKSNRKKRINKIGILLSSVFPELIHFDFSEESISGQIPMFYFYNSPESKNYFLLKLADVIRDSYAILKLTEDEIVKIESMLDKLVDTIDIVNLESSVSSDVYNKALSYYLAYLTTTEKVQVSKGDVKTVGPNGTVDFGKYEKKEDYADLRDIQLLLSHNGSRIESVSTPIVNGNLAFSYVFAFNVRNYTDDKVEIILELSMRNWITEDSFNCRFTGNKSVYITSAQSNKLNRFEFSNKKMKAKTNRLNAINFCGREGSEYSIGFAEQSIINECCSHKDFWSILDNPKENISDNVRMFAGIPVSKDIIWQLTSSRIFDNLGIGIIDCKYFYEKFLDIFEKHLPIHMSEDMELLSTSNFAINSVSYSKDIFDVHKFSIDGDISENINIVYYCSDDELISGLLDMMNSLKTSIGENVFNLVSNTDCKYTYESIIGDKKYVLNLIIVSTTIFSDMIPKFDISTIDVSGMVGEDAKEYISKMKDKYLNSYIKKYRREIINTREQYNLINSHVSNIVDVEDYHLRKIEGLDPYSFIKQAFMEEGEHVQIRNLKAFKNVKEKDTFIKKSQNILKSCMKDIFTKMGVYINFENPSKSFKQLETCEIRELISLDYISLCNIKMIAAVKLCEEGLYMKVPNINISRDSFEYRGTGQWYPISDAFEKINILKKDISSFRGDITVLKAQSLIINKKFAEIISTPNNMLYIMRNVFYKQYEDLFKTKKRVIWYDEIMVKHLIFKNKEGIEDFTAGCAVAKDTCLGNRYLTTSTRPTTLKHCAKLSSRYVMVDADVRRARGILFDIINVENSDIIAACMHEMRKMSVSYEVSTIYPHPLYLSNLLNEEIQTNNI